MTTPVYSAMLDALASQVGQATGLPATRDPGAVPGLVASDAGGCVLVGFPTAVGRLLDGANLDVPVVLVTRHPGDLRAADWLLEHLDDLLGACRAGTATNGPLDIGDLTFPAVTVTTRIALGGTP
jgi:hypothetical protein